MNREIVSEHVSQRQALMGIAVGVLMMVSLTWLPAMVGRLTEGYGLTNAEVGRLAFAELGGLLCGTLASSGKDLRSLRRWVLIALLALIVANIISAWVGGAGPLLLLRPIAGFATGVGFAFALMLASLSSRPTRCFGILSAGFSVVTIIGFQIFGALRHAHGSSGGEPFTARHDATGIFILYAALGCVALVLLITGLRNVDARVSPVTPIGSRRPLPAKAFVALLAVALSFLGFGGVWAFLQIVAQTNGLSATVIANATSSYAVMGIVGSAAASFLPERAPRWWAALGTLPILFCGLYEMYGVGSPSGYFVGCALLGIYWNFNLPNFLGQLASIDASGTAAILGGTMSNGGTAFGSLLAGMIVHGTHYSQIGWTAAALCVASFGCLFLVCVRPPPPRYPQSVGERVP
jgi:predicted MFS family arabinose efflux permease